MMQDAQDSHVKHALQVRQAMALGDCTEVCRLYSLAPCMGQALLDVCMPKVRLTGLKVMLKACAPSLPVSFIAERLGFVQIASHKAVAPETNSAALPGCSSAVFQGRFFPEVTPQGPSLG